MGYYDSEKPVTVGEIGSATGMHGFISGQSAEFNGKVSGLNTELKIAMEKLQEDASNPKYLASYQALLSEYTLYRSAQSNVSKVYKDVAAGIITNFR